MARCHENGNFDPTLVVFGRAPTSSRAVFKGNLHWIGVARILLGRNVESKV